MYHWHDRATLKNCIRDWFSQQGALEVDTPVLVRCPGAEIHLDYFSSQFKKSSHNQAPFQEVFLRSSPELQLKVAVAELGTSVFQVGPCFRNGRDEESQWHHPEFTMLEYYIVDVSFRDFLKNAAEMFQSVSQKFFDATINNSLSKAHRENLEKKLASFEFLSVQDAFEEFAGLAFVDGDPDFAVRASEISQSVSKDDDFETAFFKIFVERVDVALASRGAVLLHGFPASQSALAKSHDGIASRFEIYLDGIEACNGYDELNDTNSNAEKFKAINSERRVAGKQEIPVCQKFLDAAASLPQCCGNAVGFDRWLAWLRGEKSIHHVVPQRYI